MATLNDVLGELHFLQGTTQKIWEYEQYAGIIRDMTLYIPNWNVSKKKVKNR